VPGLLRTSLIETNESPLSSFVRRHVVRDLDRDSDTLGTLIVESIDETLSDLLGARAREAIYDYLERDRKSVV
jgi:hypothetical protein